VAVLWRFVATVAMFTSLAVVGAVWDLGSEPLLPPSARRSVLAALVIVGFVFGGAVGEAVDSLRQPPAQLLVHTARRPTATVLPCFFTQPPPMPGTAGSKGVPPPHCA